MQVPVVEVPVSGELDLASAPPLRAALHECIEAHPGAEVLVDLSKLTFIDSSGLGLLVGALKKARAAGGDLRVVRCPARLRPAFDVTSLDRVFRMDAA